MKAAVKCAGVLSTMNAVCNGANEKSILRINDGHGVVISPDFVYNKSVDAAILEGIDNGMCEKSILAQASDHYKTSHPTQKPVRLAERIIALISDPGDTIYDPFMGSGSFGCACVNTGRKYIGCEIDAKYFQSAVARIKEAVGQNMFYTSAG
jgi:site-specific DNA-methyltransferase (adenine-specific)